MLDGGCTRARYGVLGGCIVDHPEVKKLQVRISKARTRVIKHIYILCRSSNSPDHVKNNIQHI